MRHETNNCADGPHVCHRDTEVTENSGFKGTASPYRPRVPLKFPKSFSVTSVSPWQAVGAAMERVSPDRDDARAYQRLATITPSWRPLSPAR